MTAADDGFEFEDPEETAGSTANRVYQRFLLRKAALVLLALAGYMAFVAVDYVFGALALWHLPLFAAGLLTGFMTSELFFFVRSYVLSRRSRREEKPAVVTDGDKMTAALDSMRRAQERPVPPPWWRQGPRRVVFWQCLAVRSIYSACAGVVLVSWGGLPAGVAAAVAYTCAALLLGYASRPALTSMLRAASFADPRPPRDTPET